MDRLLDLNRIVLIAVFVLSACKDDGEAKKDAVAPSRFQSVKNAPKAAKAAESFCEKSFPASGATARRWNEPPSRPMPQSGGASSEVNRSKGGWTWVNLWASWCGPCIKEFPLLSRWRDTLAREGLSVRFELWSVDATESDLVAALDRPFPGEVRWLRSEEDLPAFLEGIGVEKGSAIPIHALVDPHGNLRCVRVGSIGEESYGVVRTILAGG